MLGSVGVGAEGQGKSVVRVDKAATVSGLYSINGMGERVVSDQVMRRGTDAMTR